MRRIAAPGPELLAAYDEQIRRRPVPDGPDDVVEHEDGVVRCVSITGWSGVSFADLAGRDADAVIAAQVARFDGPWEWKHHSHDRPADLPERLLAAGFEAGETETLVVADLRALAVDAPPPAGIELELVGAEGVPDLLAVHDVVFGGDHAALGRAVLAGLRRGSAVPVVAYDGGAPVAASRLELVEGTDFAGLWGDSTLPSHRGRGLFRTMVAVRARIARERGFRYLQADALETSRPLFARLGFVELARTTPYVKRSATMTPWPS
jgi:GNAT superfamily N-acetyltransferase